MTSSAVSMELSVSFVSWINDQMRDQVEARNTVTRTRRNVSVVRSFVVAGVACISFVLATIIAT
ncbi:MAG: hypothetical protein ISQ06_05715 [Planctomycetaceae bacterium]|jgi:hypothetical protein|nr:hypothetical protein [Planctomycetaceae bacterium]